MTDIAGATVHALYELRTSVISHNSDGTPETVTEMHSVRLFSTEGAARLAKRHAEKAQRKDFEDWAAMITAQNRRDLEAYEKDRKKMSAELTAIGMAHLLPPYVAPIQEPTSREHYDFRQGGTVSFCVEPLVVEESDDED